MKEVMSSVTKRGQVTLPADVRRILGIKPGDKIVFQIENDEIRIARAQYTLETAFGSVTPLSSPENFQELSRIAHEEIAEKILRKMKQH